MRIIVKILHLFRDKPDILAKDMIKVQSAGCNITAVLIQEAAIWTGNLPCDILVLKDDIRDCFLEIERSNIEYKELLFTGGGSRNDLWLTIKSDVTGKVLKVIDFNETAILGAALLGGVCAGIYRDSMEAAEKTGNKQFRYVKPDMERHENYCKYSINNSSPPGVPPGWINGKSIFKMLAPFLAFTNGA